METFHKVRQNPAWMGTDATEQVRLQVLEKKWYRATAMGQLRCGRDRATPLELERRANNQLKTTQGQQFLYFRLLLGLHTQKDHRPGKLRDKAVPYHDSRRDAQCNIAMVLQKGQRVTEKITQHSVRFAFPTTRQVLQQYTAVSNTDTFHPVFSRTRCGRSLPREAFKRIARTETLLQMHTLSAWLPDMIDDARSMYVAL